VKTRMTKWLGAALLAVAGLAGTAKAAPTNPADLYILVTVAGNKSVTVNGTQFSTSTTLAWGGVPNQTFASVAGATTTVQNNGSILTEGWELSTSATFDQTAATPWANAASTTSVGTNQFAVQAVFGSSATAAGGCPAAAAADWNNSAFASALTNAPVQYTTVQYADTGLNTGGGTTWEPDNVVTNQMLPFNAGTGVGQRALCWRVMMPSSVTTVDTQEIVIVVTAL